jgi:epoxyqueuosine reductase
VTPQTNATLQVFVETFIRDYLSLPENNSLGPHATGKAWNGFLVGYSSGADDLYPFLKRHIGEFHWTPAEAFAFGSAEAVPAGAESAATEWTGVDAPKPDELTVVSWALCQTEEAKAANRRETFFPSEPWARSRIFGQRGNLALHRALVKALGAQGYPAVAPALLSGAGERQSPAYGRASTWSERHVAHISGLGTFGLCGGLITERGQAVRLGSVVVRAEIPPTPRPYDDPFAYCLYFSHGSCVACIKRCPVGSVSEKGRDKHACSQHLEPVTAEFVKREYGFEGYGCGLCQTGVPCESKIPKPPRGRVES